MCQLCASLGYNTHLVDGSSSAFEAAAAAPTFTLNQIISQLRTSWGDQWEDTLRKWSGASVTYSIADAYPTNATFTEQELVIMSATMKNVARLGFELWDDLIAINLNESANNPAANITFNLANKTEDEDGYVVTSGGTYARATLGGLSGGYYQIATEQIWLNKDWNGGTHNEDGDLIFGRYGVLTYIHEIGHALGLSHPGSYDASDNEDITYATHAEFAQDNRQYTVMSYFGGYFLETWRPDGSEPGWLYPSTPMLFDIAAIQATYGADYTTRAGNSTYGYNITSDVAARSANGLSIYSFSHNTSPVFTIWDGGGIDTLDCSGYSAIQTIRLTAGSYSHIGGLSGNIAIAYNCTIENAIGGSGVDLITGNTADNLLRGNGGNDVIDGGDGTDTAVFAGNRSAYTLTSLGGAGVRVTFTSTGEYDTLTNVERLQFADQTTPWTPSNVTDDFADSISDATSPFGTIAVGGSQTGAIEILGDRDWFRVQLTAGTPYTIRMDQASGGTGPLTASLFQIHDSSGTLINEASYNPLSHVSALSFTPTTTGTYYINAGAYTDASTGTYRLSVEGPNTAPVMTASQPSMRVAVGQTIALSSLFSASDSDGDVLTYELFDGSAMENSGHFMVNGTAIPAFTSRTVTAAEFAQATFVAGAQGSSDLLNVRAFDGEAYSATGLVELVVNFIPYFTVLQGQYVNATAGQSIAVSSLFSATDPDGDPLTYYVYDSNAGASSGRFMLNGTALSAQSIHPLSAAQFAQVTFVAGAAGITDDIRVQAFDGRNYSGWDAFVNVSVPANRAPVVTAPQTNVTATAGQSIAVSSLFSATDPDGDALTYYVYDSNVGANSGRFMVNGTALSAQSIHPLTAAQFSQATFVAGAAGNIDDIRVQVFDGKAYSGWNTAVNVAVPAAVNRAPVVTAPQANVTATADQSIAVSSLFSATDPDGDALIYYVYDSTLGANSGRFMVNGMAVQAQSIYPLTAAQFAQTTFVAGAAGVVDDIRVQVFDGKAYSGWNTGVTVTVPAPADDFRDSLSDTTAPFGQVTVNGTRTGNLEVNGDRDWFAIQLTANVSYTFNLHGATGGGGTLLDPILSLYGSNGTLLAINDDINGANVDSQFTYRPTTSGTYYLQAGSSNNAQTGTYRIGFTAPANQAPTVTAPQANVTATAGQSIALSSLFSASDADGDTLTYYVYDSNAGASSGRFMLNGTALAAQSIHPLSAAQFAQATFVAGTAGNTDDIRVQAFDGKAYSGWNTFVNVAVPAAVNHAPTVSLPAGASYTASSGESIWVSSLFSGHDSDGDALTYYLYDSNAAANSGHFVVGGNVVPAQTITSLTASQFASATFVTGATNTHDDILVQTFDGKAYSGWNASVDVDVPAGANHAPTLVMPSGNNVSTVVGVAIQLSALFSGSDLDGDTLNYILTDISADPHTSYYVIDGVRWLGGGTMTITAAQFAEASFVPVNAQFPSIVEFPSVSVFDGSDVATSSVRFTFTGGNHKPMVGLPAGASVDADAGESLALSSLFRGSDVDDNALSYFIYDSNPAANSGHFVVGGNVVAAGTITPVTAAQLAQATFVAGAAGTADDIMVQAFDGQLYSGWNAGVHVFV